MISFVVPCCKDKYFSLRLARNHVKECKKKNITSKHAIENIEATII